MGLVSNFIQTPPVNECILPESSQHLRGLRAETRRGAMEGAMHDSRRYRDSAAECLLAAQEACELHCRRLHLSMADSWLSLARRDEAMDNLLASWDTAEPVKTDGLGA
jgi:hypothetical protein